MKFIIDAQLPKSLYILLDSKGCDCIHTFDLPLQNATPDNEIIKVSEKENRVLITKDTDFLNSHILFEKPKKLIIVRTGNIKNQLLLSIIDKNFSLIIKLLKHNSLIELTKEDIIAH